MGAGSLREALLFGVVIRDSPVRPVAV